MTVLEHLSLHPEIHPDAQAAEAGAHLHSRDVVAGCTAACGYRWSGPAKRAGDDDVLCPECLRRLIEATRARCAQCEESR